MTREAKTMLEQLRGMVARGWCHPENSHKEFDGDLAEAIVEEVEREFQSQYRAGAEAMRERVEDIDVLIQVADYLNQVGGGPMEDRLRLLYEALRSAPIEGEK